MSEINFFLYEAMDRSAVIMDEFLEYVKSLPPIEEDEELKEQANKCFKELMNFYQLAANRWYNSTKDNPDIWEPRKKMKDENSVSG